jgi:hypothetical protein
MGTVAVCCENYAKRSNDLCAEFLIKLPVCCKELIFGFCGYDDEHTFSLVKLICSLAESHNHIYGNGDATWGIVRGRNVSDSRLCRTETVHVSELAPLVLETSVVVIKRSV